MTAIAYGSGSPGLRLDLVIRTSKRKAEAKSPQQQIDMAEACAQAHGHRIVHVHDSGTDESGKTMNRATLRAARERHKAGLTDGIIVALADRLGRAPIEEAMTVVRSWCTDGNLVLADMGGVPIDLSNGVNETNVVMQLQFARQYWLTTANRFLRSQRDALARGKWIGRAPLGYAKVRSGERKGCLTVSQAHADRIAHAYRLAGSDGLHAAQSYLQAHYPGRFSTTDHVRRVLRSRAYRGEVHYKGFEANLMAHEPIVSETEWKAAQTKPRHRATSGDYPLSHKIHCQRCGAGLVGAMQTVPALKRDPENWRKHIKDPDGTPRKYRRYRCSNTKCKGGTSVRAEVVEGYVLATLRKALGDEEWVGSFAPVGLVEATRAMRAASDEVTAYNKDTEARALLGDDRWREGLRERVRAERAATEAWQAVAERAGYAENLPQPDELDDPEQFERGLDAVLTVVRFDLTPGRGSIESRFVIVALDDQQIRPFPA